MSWASSPLSRRRMQTQPQRDTKPELALRSELHARGLRYRLQHRPENDLRWRLDVVFIGARVAVDVRGCFWHACPHHGTAPTVNAARWADKLARNVERDARVVEALQTRGWEVIVVWEHDDPLERATFIEQRVRARLAQRVAPVGRRRGRTSHAGDGTLPRPGPTHG